MMNFAYKRLLNITNTVPPYRGTLDRFPFHPPGRKSQYHFLRDVEDGQTIFKVCNGYFWERKEVSPDEYDSNNHRHHKETVWCHSSNKAIPTGSYYKYDRESHVFGISRSDNTFTLTTKHMGQGERLFFARNTAGWCMSQSRRGGVIYCDRGGLVNNKYIIPLTRGMRFLCDSNTPRPIGNYQLFGQRVSRKGAKAELAKYENFYRVVETMMKNMTGQVFTEIAREAVLAHKIDVNRFWMPMREQKQWLDARLDDLINDSPIDAAVFFCTIMNIDRLWELVKSGGFSSRNIRIEYVFNEMRKKINDYLYHTRPGVLVLKEYKFGKMYPQSVWGYKVLCNGTQVKQY